MSALMPTESGRSRAEQSPLPVEGTESPRPLLDDHVCIRGVRLRYSELVDRSFFAPEQRERLRQQLELAQPFPHLVLDGLFHPALLELVAEEFDTQPASSWAEVKSPYECTRRLLPGESLQTASQLYFDIVSSGWFTAWLTSITGVPYLLSDPKLWGGGLHESRSGGAFSIHRDFYRHRDIGLRNAMVFITYLNKGWQPEWGSALELWDKKADRCAKSIQPEFGRTMILPHGPVSYHGHTKPLKTPDGRPRRSVAAYFYTSPFAGKRHGDESASTFLHPARIDQAKTIARMIVPPFIWALGRKVMGR
ncbi:Proline 4-hydroxylase (includes Rps23 Pro-64 3,4-dihydroxylase Tpa1), contains SM-20 domain [Variovorax sp. HW608]|nr:Proline 4-hydroxylase (includes Rps23 Pro-64 3,4-dihydroxylase Tpa1), contains SM-20 domain [Variovorax sp. HW608]